MEEESDLDYMIRKTGKSILWGMLIFLINLSIFFYYLKDGNLFCWTGGLWDYIKKSSISGIIFYSIFEGYCKFDYSRKKHKIASTLFFASIISLLALIFKRRAFATILISFFALLGVGFYWIVLFYKFLLGFLPISQFALTLFDYMCIAVLGVLFSVVLIKSVVKVCLDEEREKDSGNRKLT